MHKQKYFSQINIPAHDATGEGVVVELYLKVIMNRKLSFNSKGNIASALKNNFQHVIKVMSDIRDEWKILDCSNYILECSNEKFIVRDSKSSSLALSILILNIYREMNGKKQIDGLTGSGILRIDGSFQSANHEAKKHLAVIKKMGPNGNFIMPSECGHLHELESLMNLN